MEIVLKTYHAINDRMYAPLTFHQYYLSYMSCLIFEYVWYCNNNSNGSNHESGMTTASILWHAAEPFAWDMIVAMHIYAPQSVPRRGLWIKMSKLNIWCTWNKFYKYL